MNLVKTFQNNGVKALASFLIMGAASAANECKILLKGLSDTGVQQIVTATIITIGTAAIVAHIVSNQGKIDAKDLIGAVVVLSLGFGGWQAIFKLLGCM